MRIIRLLLILVTLGEFHFLLQRDRMLIVVLSQVQKDEGHVRFVGRTFEETEARWI